MSNSLGLIAYTALWLIAILETVILCALARKMFGIGSALLAQVASDGPPLGVEVPALTGVTTVGSQYTIGGPAPNYQVILFLSPNCSSCRMTMRWLPQFIADRNFIGSVVVDGTLAAVQRFGAEYLFEGPLIPNHKGEVTDRLQVTASPFVIVLDTSGRVIGKGAMVTSDDLYDIFRVAQMRERLGAINRDREVERSAV